MFNECHLMVVCCFKGFLHYGFPFPLVSVFDRGPSQFGPDIVLPLFVRVTRASSYRAKVGGHRRGRYHGRGLVGPLEGSLFRLVFRRRLCRLPFLRGARRVRPPILSPPMLRSLPTTSLGKLLIPLHQRLSLRFRSSVSSCGCSIPF